MTSEQELLREKLAWSRSKTLEGRYLNVYMDQNNRCNLRCRMCGFADPRIDAVPSRDMPRQLFDSIAKQIFPHANYVQLSAFTEPFMTADFPDRLGAVAEYEVPESQIITNGTLLTRRSIEKIIDARIGTITFSIDGGTKETYESIRIGARFERVVANLFLLREIRDSRGSERPRIRINHVLSKWNIDAFDEFAAFVEHVRPEELNVFAVERMAFDTGGEWDDPEFVAKVQVVRQRQRDLLRRTGILYAGFLRDEAGPIELFTREGERMTCRRPWDSVAIHANGDVQPCMAWTRPPIGNLARQSFDEIWTGAEGRALRTEFETRRPGVDCLFCTAKMNAPSAYDDFFYRMISK